MGEINANVSADIESIIKEAQPIESVAGKEFDALREELDNELRQIRTEQAEAISRARDIVLF